MTPVFPHSQNEKKQEGKGTVEHDNLLLLCLVRRKGRGERKGGGQKREKGKERREGAPPGPWKEGKGPGKGKRPQYEIFDGCVV